MHSDNSVLYIKLRNSETYMTKPVGPSVYAQAGVNVSLGDKFSSFCGDRCRSTYESSRFVQVHDFSHGHFRGRRGFEFINLPKGTINTAGSDGIGTKVIIIDASGRHRTAGDNLLAMVAGDFTRDGCLPLVVLNHLDVKTLGENDTHPTYLAAQELMFGFCKSAKQEGYVLLGGETAELSACVTSENPNATLQFNWGAVAIGVMHPDKMITGNDIKVGDRIIALRDVTRSNGISLIRRGFRHRYGNEWYENIEAQPAIRQAATPSALYDRFFVHANGWTTEDFEPVVKVRLIAHLSGGGIQSKFGDDLLFPRGFSAVFNNLWAPPQVMKDCASDLAVTDQECYEVWGCGQGALVVVAPDDIPAYFRLARTYPHIELRDAGVITETRSGDSPTIRLNSGFTGDNVVLRPK